MVKAWFLYAMHQVSAALALAALILMLSEILIPGSILPYFNLHILIVAAVLSALVSPVIDDRPRWWMIVRAATLSIIALTILGYAFLFFGTSVSGLMLLAALAILLVGLFIALIRPESELQPQLIEQVFTKEVAISNDSVEIIEEETSVFMR